MKSVYGNFQQFSFGYDPENFCFKGFYHKFDDDSEKVFVTGRILQKNGMAFPVGVEPSNTIDWPIDGRKNTISYRSGDSRYDFDLFFEITQAGLKINCSANALIEGHFCWSQDINDTLAGVFAASGGATLQSSSGPAVLAGDDMLFDRRKDRALRFVPKGSFKLGFDWEKEAYSFRFYPNGTIADSGLLFEIKENFIADRMHMRYVPIDKHNQFPTPPVGWMTWYATRFEACEKEVLENTAKLKEIFGAYTDKLVSWVDWEWYHKNIKGDGEGDGNVFSPCKDTYPNGLAFVAEKIKEMGVIPAVWIGPTCEGNKNKWFEAHPDCIIGPYPRWCGQWWVNPAKDEVVNEYIPMVMKQVKDWGYHVVKWDCQTMTSYVWEEYWDELGAPALSVDQLEHRIIASGRKALGDEVFLLLCNPVCDHDISVGSDLCDAARIGGDIFKWDEFLEQAVVHLFHFYPIHNTMLYADCDNIVIRKEYNNIEQARSRISFYGLTGVPVTLGDRFSEYDDERIHMLRRIVPVVDMHPVEFVPKVPTGADRRVLARFCRKFGSWLVLAVTNISPEKTIEAAVDLAEDCRLETGNGRKYAIYDFWNKRFLGVFDKSAMVSIAPQDTAVLRITPVTTGDLPVLISSSRHITQGGHELLDMAVSENAVSGVTLCVAGEPCVLTFLLPEGKTVTARNGIWKQEGSCGTLTLSAPLGGEVTWRLEVSQ